MRLKGKLKSGLKRWYISVLYFFVENGVEFERIGGEERGRAGGWQILNQKYETRDKRWTSQIILLPVAFLRE